MRVVVNYNNVSDKTLKSVEFWCGYYRSNPHRFAQDILNLDLKLFQKILLVMMNWCTSLSFIAARGIGKSYLSAIFCVTRAVLYPGSKIIIASGTRSQAVGILNKITLELKPNSPALAFEIKYAIISLLADYNLA